MDDEQDLLVADEIRWETRGADPCGSGGCNCQPGGDGPPCPHGNFDIQYKHRVTDAERAIAALKDWEYEEPESEDPESEDPAEMDWISSDEPEPKPEGETGLFLRGLLDLEFKGDSSTTAKEMRFNDMTGEWEEEV